jgi:hypothetical protein
VCQWKRVKSAVIHAWWAQQRAILEITMLSTKSDAYNHNAVNKW